MPPSGLWRKKRIGVTALRAPTFAQIGVLLTLERPTKPMEDWARAAGMCEVPGFAPVNRLQIVTIEQALGLRERAVEMPARRDDTFKKAPVEVDRRAQGKLDL